MGEDALYALNEVFVFAANTEKTFINAMSSCINGEIDNIDSTIANLKHSKALLEEHILHLQETLRVLETRGSSKWPRCSEPSNVQVVEEARKELEADFKYLLARAEMLAARCVAGMSMIASDVQLEEARKVIEEAAQTKRLTILAFFYLPLSLTAGVFGINCIELGTGDRSIWIAFVSALFVSACTLVAYYWERLPWSRTRISLRDMRRQKEEMLAMGAGVKVS
jgi:Mg2+ and Co2+ transporter CorA